jgi:2-succinyl-6-hydroxy-2,4-cyclohexadiene-1-carboxylate synthase
VNQPHPLRNYFCAATLDKISEEFFGSSPSVVADFVTERDLAMPLEKTDFVGELPDVSPEPVVIDPTATTTPDGCPNPLGWAQVLEAFHAQSTSWSIRVGDDSVSGRTLGNGRPLYFLNGLTGTSDLFCLLVWLLRDDFQCVVFDYSTRKERGRGAVTPARLAADLFAAADLHGDSTFSLFATSFGSVVALTALTERPAQIDRAILQGAFAHRKLSAVERTLCRLGRFIPGTLAGVPFRDTIERANHQRYFPPFDRSRWGFLAENAGRTSIRDAAERAALVGRFDYRPRLADIQQPVLLIRSEHEGLVSAACNAELERGLANPTIEMLHSTGPLAHLAHPHRLAKLVRSFLGDSPLSAAPAGSV